MEKNFPAHPVFIGEPIHVDFRKQPVHEKAPPCPDLFEWRGDRHIVKERLSEWKDFQRRGRLARNMRPAHMRRALRTGSRGSGRFYFRVRTEGGRVFDLYYDRSVKDAEDHGGQWILFREYIQDD